MGTTTATTPTDDELVQQSHRSPEVFGRIFDRHFDAVLAYARARIGPDVGAEIASETFTRAFAVRGRYRANASGVRPWLMGIATNLIGDHRRAEARHLRWLAGASVEVSGDEVDAAVERLDAHRHARAVAGAVKALRRDQRDVLLMHAWGDLTPDQIATALGLPAGTVRSHLSRARAQLKLALGDTESVRLEAGNG